MTTPPDYKREVLPLHLEPFVKEATSMTSEAYVKLRPWPVLIYTRSKLWDRSLLLARSNEEGRETQVVRYELYEGGISFIHPIRKLQTDPNHPGIVLGRALNQDMVVPVASISSAHVAFIPPQPGVSPTWTVTDLGSRNGTWLGEAQLEARAPKPLQDGEYLRLGGNLLAWFFTPQKLWAVLRKPAELQRYTEI